MLHTFCSREAAMENSGHHPVLGVVAAIFFRPSGPKNKNYAALDVSPALPGETYDSDGSFPDLAGSNSRAAV